MEVWFDQDKLAGADAWAATCRRQIKAGGRFIAVISQNTQARHKGCFHIEWDLTAERTRDITSGVAFVLPVVITPPRGSESLGPDRLRAVHETRLPGGMMAREFVATLKEAEARAK